MSNPPKGRSGGVLSVNAAARKNTAAQSGPKSSSRTPAPRLKLIVRRLPPGLTETEFWAVLGDDWKVGAGKVEWGAFRDGKISKDPAKPSRPSRAYLKVKDKSLLDSLSAAVKESSFQDAKNTSKDACLLGPPSLEFAPYNKTPNARTRNDGRQGTIDQDQEFIDFLQKLTEPIAKGALNGADSGEAKPEKVSVTPLVQYIKDKKANKAKEASQAKAAAKAREKEAKAAKPEPRSTVIIKGKAAPTAPEKERTSKGTQDAVKAINKSVAAMQGKQTTTKTEAKQSAKEAGPQTTSGKRERERGSGTAAARMLQRDLGLATKETKSQRTPKASASSTTGASGTTTTAKPTVASLNQKTDSSADRKQSSTPTPTPAPPSGPRASRASSAASTKAPATPSQRPSKPGPQPSAGAKSAFLKHANPSQGITEELLQTALKDFGTITRCEIDKKKGLGYVDFGDPEGLKKAMAASPVKVANGQVVVLENKTPFAKRGGQGGQTQGNAVSGKAPANASASAAANSPKVAVATASATTTTTTVSLPAAASASQADAPTTPITPTAGATPSSVPRGTPKGPSAGRSGRGGGGGAGAGGGGGGAGRGNTRASGQGSRQGNRSGRGNQSSGKRGGGGGGGGSSTSTGAVAASGDGAAAPVKEEAKKD